MSWLGSEGEDDKYIDTDVDEEIYEGTSREVTKGESKDFEKGDGLDLDDNEEHNEETEYSDEDMDDSGDIKEVICTPLAIWSIFYNADVMV